MTATPRDLLQRLFEYIEEQAKEIDPRGFQLSKQKGFRCSPGDIAGLPGVSMDLQLEGDHVWLRVDRLEASKPPAVPPALQGLCKPSSDPDGHLPALDEAALLHRIHAESDKPADTRADKADKPADKLAEKQAAKRTDTPENERENQRVALEARIRAHASEALREYTGLWKSWAEGEKPRWKTISLYGDRRSTVPTLSCRPSTDGWTRSPSISSLRLRWMELRCAPRN